MIDLCECDTCEGTGTIAIVNTVTVDSGTKWKRSADEMVNVECHNCNGIGFTEE